LSASTSAFAIVVVVAVDVVKLLNGTKANYFVSSSSG